MEAERLRFERIQDGSWINRVFGRSREGLTDDRSPPLVEICEVSVNECFVSYNFNEEFPLYIFPLDGYILIIFGQWLYDPNVTIIPEDIFEKWNCNRSFFSSFEVRFHENSGMVLALRINGDSFCPVKPLPHDIKFKTLRECQILSGNSNTLIHDMQVGGVTD